MNGFLNQTQDPRFLIFFFFTGIPWTDSPFSTARVKRGSLRHAAEIRVGPCAPTLLSQASGEATWGRGAQAATGLSGQRCRPRGTLLSSVKVQLSPPYPKMPSGTRASREAAGAAEPWPGFAPRPQQPRGERRVGVTRGTEPRRRSIASGPGPGSSEAPTVKHLQVKG